MLKARPDRWSTNPVQISSFIEFPAAAKLPPGALPGTQNFSSPTCGLGWRFDFSRSFQYEVSKSNADVQERRGRITATFRTNQCTGMQFRNLTVTVNVEFLGRKIREESSTFKQVFNHTAISQDLQIGAYVEPFPHQGKTTFEITVAFNPNDRLSLPTTISPHLTQALASSLDGQMLINTKFYLFSGKVKGKAGRPRAVYGNAALLTDTSTYVRDLLSDTGFQDGIPCGLYEDVPEVLSHLKDEYYDYDSDSDLESLPDFDDEEDEFSSAGRLIANTQPPISSTGATDLENPPPQSSPQDTAQADGVSSPLKSKRDTQVRAYAINGTACQTWKAFVYYAYTGETQFKLLKSNPRFALFATPATVTLGMGHDIACSPKSMYRLADYAGLLALKNLAKEGVGVGLSEDNVVTELFSRFTSKHDEIIEMEVDFLLRNFTPKVSQDFDDAIESIVAGFRPYCYRTLAFAIKRLHNEDSATAWASLKGRPGCLSASVLQAPKKGAKGKRRLGIVKDAGRS